MDRRLVQRPVSSSSEHGATRLKFIMVILIVVIVVVTVGDAGCLYVPFVYKAHNFKGQMQGTVDHAATATTQEYQVAWITDQLTKSERDYDVPADAVITVSQAENRNIARVQFTQRIPFPAYWTQVKEGEKMGEWYIRTSSGHVTYNFEFDYTVISATSLQH